MVWTDEKKPTKDGKAPRGYQQREAISTHSLKTQDTVVPVRRPTWGYDLLERNSASNKHSLARRDWGINVPPSFYSHPSISSQGFTLAKSPTRNQRAREPS